MVKAWGSERKCWVLPRLNDLEIAEICILGKWTWCDSPEFLYSQKILWNNLPFWLSRLDGKGLNRQDLTAILQWLICTSMVVTILLLSGLYSPFFGQENGLCFAWHIWDFGTSQFYIQCITTSIDIYIYICIHICIQICMQPRQDPPLQINATKITQSHIHSFVHSFIHSFIHSYINSFIHTYINSFIHSYIHTYIHT